MSSEKNEENKLEKNIKKEDFFRYKNLLEVLPELVFELGLDGKVQYVNQSGLDKFGYTKEEFINNYNIPTFFPDDALELTESFKKLIIGEEFEKKTYSAKTKNGKRIPVIISSTLVQDNDKSCIRGVIVEVTDQKELEDRFQNLFLLSPFSTIIFKPETGNIKLLNPYAEKLLGVNKQKLENENVFFFVHDSGLLTFRNYIKSVGKNYFGEKYNTFISTKNGEERNVEISSARISISGKEYIQCIFRDTTEIVLKDLKEIEHRKQKELLALSVFQLNKYKDKDSMFKYIAQTLHAFNPKSIIIVGDYIEGKHKLKLNHIQGSKIDKITDILQIDINRFEIDVVDYPQPDNRLFVDIESVIKKHDLKTNLSKVKFGLLKKMLKIKNIYTCKLLVNQKILGGIAILTPNENFLIENEFIEIFIAQASIILDRISYEEQLISAKEKAIESDRLKSSFLSNMSHEIRTPMNSILGFSNLILNEDLTEELKSKYSMLMQTSGEVLVKLIDDIIDISKIESNQLEIQEEEFIVNDMIEELKIEYVNVLTKDLDRVEMIFKNQESRIKIKSDKGRIKQILNNLINNSTKFTNKGTIDIWFELKGKQIVFHVKDSGIGINKEKQKIIFDRFRQADESSTRPFRGAGLGLAISKHLANILGGDILVNSKRNIGAEFIVTIPTNMNIEHIEEKSYIKPHTITNLDWSKYSVFIAEDEESNFFLLEAYLSQTGIKYEWFKNGKELLDGLKIKQPDFVLLDLKMPEMDGYTAASKMKNKYPELYIIAQTAYAMADEKKKAIEAGCDDFVTKPIKKEVLYYKIGKYLK